MAPAARSGGAATDALDSLSASWQDKYTALVILAFGAVTIGPSLVGARVLISVNLLSEQLPWRASRLTVAGHQVCTSDTIDAEMPELGVHPQPALCGPPRLLAEPGGRRQPDVKQPQRGPAGPHLVARPAAAALAGTGVRHAAAAGCCDRGHEPVPASAGHKPGQRDARRPDLRDDRVHGGVVELAADPGRSADPAAALVGRTADPARPGHRLAGDRARRRGHAVRRVPAGDRVRALPRRRLPAGASGRAVPAPDRGRPAHGPACRCSGWSSARA